MLGDYFTKRVQGLNYQTIRLFIIGIKIDLSVRTTGVC